MSEIIHAFPLHIWGPHLLLLWSTSAINAKNTSWRTSGLEIKEVRGEIRHLASPFTLFLPPPTWLRNTLQLECCQSPCRRNVFIETPLLWLNTFMAPDVEGHDVDKITHRPRKRVKIICCQQQELLLLQLPWSSASLPQ